MNSELLLPRTVLVPALRALVESAPELRCGDCAFTKGTEANLTSWTRLKIELCLTSGEPFLCHAKGEPKPLCVGFTAALRNQQEQPEWRQKVSSALLELQHLAELDAETCNYISDNFAECLEVVLEDIANERADSTSAPPQRSEEARGIGFT